MELRQLKCFVAVAEELHFRKAAEQIGMAQTALSAQINNLEQELGCRLFFRTTRHVSLTQAGSVFLDESRFILKRLEQSIEKTRSAATSGLNSIRIGGIDAALVWFLPTVIDKFRRQFPNIHLPLTEVSSSAQQIQELLRHRIDVAFFRPPTEVAGVISETLFEENIFVAIPEDSRLIGKASLTPHDLIDQKLISYQRHARPYLADFVLRSFEVAGVTPTIDFEITDKSTLLQMVAKRMGVGLVPQWVTEQAINGVAYKLYESGLEPMQFGVAWRDNDQSQTLQEFLKLVRKETPELIKNFKIK